MTTLHKCQNVTLICRTRWNAAQHKAEQHFYSRWLTVDSNDSVSSPQNQNEASEQARHQQANHHQPFRGGMCPYRSGASYGEGSYSTLVIIGLKLSQQHKLQNMLLIQSHLQIVIRSTNAVSVVTLI